MSMDSKDKNYLNIESKFKYFCFLFLYFSLYPICKLLYGRKTNWLICERGTDAQDNGYFFYKYLVENHKKINAIYLIKRTSPDYRKVHSFGRVVEFGSLKHFLMVIGCPVKISSHLFGYAPWIQMALYFRRNKTRDIHIFLQHGITKNYIEGFLHENCQSLKLFVCGAKPEYDYLSKNFGYKPGIVKYTGFARYDLLKDLKTQNHILFMPTWRRYLGDLSKEEFLNSLFYKSWQDLCDSKELIDALNKNKLKLDFYLHSSLQQYSDCFKSNEVTNVIFFEDCDVQSLLKEDKLLVTDFSSVFFDFAYMKKPMVFYQFDEKDYYNGHYDKGYFDYRDDGFGDVCSAHNDAVKAIIKLINNGFQMEEKYLNRIDKYFAFNDSNNCARIFESISDLIK